MQLFTDLSTVLLHLGSIKEPDASVLTSTEQHVPALAEAATEHLVMVVPQPSRRGRRHEAGAYGSGAHGIQPSSILCKENGEQARKT